MRGTGAKHGPRNEAQSLNARIKRQRAHEPTRVSTHPPRNDTPDFFQRIPARERTAMTYRAAIVDVRDGRTHYTTPPCPTYAAALAFARAQLRRFGRWFDVRSL